MICHKTIHISMEKKYVSPAMRVEEALAALMLAESLPIIDDGETVDGEKALTKEDSAWDIWDGE